MGKLGARGKDEVAAGRHQRLCRVTVALASMIAGPTAFTHRALAQQAAPLPFEQPSRLGSSVDPVPATSASPSMDSALAAQLLDMAKLEARDGRADLAQRILENLIARYPQTEPVAQARRELYQLYAARPDIAKTPDAGPIASPVAASTTAGAGWRTSMFARPTRDEEFRSAIGDRVFFSAGSSEIGGRARNVLAAQAGWLMRNAGLVAVVEGHADPTESESGGGDLALQRAEVVRGRLIADGVEVDRVRIVSFGAGQPVATCDDGACAAQNRRTIVRVEQRHAATVGDEMTASSPRQTGRR
jgi:peptidoglycan-associated lipoprotein